MKQVDGSQAVRMRYDPCQIFAQSKSPAGLYARKKWLGEAESPAWQNDFNETVASLLDGQSADGSWSQSPVETIRRLFGLHLTVRERTGDIEQALKWLIGQVLTGDLSGTYFDDIPPAALRELPFVNARQSLLLVCATLFLASVFQLENDERIQAHCRLLSRWLVAQEENDEVWPEKSNILRAFIVFPAPARDSGTQSLVSALEHQQKPSGLWPAPIPFFLTVNVLAHLDDESARRQWRKALPLLSGAQQKDGAWGGEDREWNTFLVVHALKNKHCL